MRYYMAADGGGTKIHIIVFNERYELLGAGTGGGINLNFDSREVVRSNMRVALAAAIPPMVSHFEAVYATIVSGEDIFYNELSEVAFIGERRSLSEGYAYLLAASLRTKGVVALSGTGSGAIYCNGEREILHLGGYGLYAGDEGSGLWIGSEGLRAVGRYFDGWGPETTLVSLCEAHFGVEGRTSVFSIYKGASAHSAVSRFSCEVKAAADDGDAVAIKILREAGGLMGRQILGLFRVMGREPSEETPVYMCGGAWKCGPCMTDAFEEAVATEYPAVRIYSSLFEPIVGGVVQNMLDAGVDPVNSAAHIRKEFHQYIGKAAV